jgi:hypothetical protein
MKFMLPYSNIINKLILSIVVIFHDMRREAERTLYTLSSAYQTGVSDADYKVIAVDNASTYPLSTEFVHEFGSNFRYHFFETESVSPASAVNFGVRMADSESIAVIVDGARMVTPGLVSATLKALQVFAAPFVCTLAWHLGPDVQNVTIGEGYDSSEEDKLLESIEWRANGYRLFEISTLAQSSHVGFLGGMPAECSWFAMPRATFLETGGFDERFQSPGGGLVNHDFLNRVVLQPAINPVILLGEGSFHQIHGGVATNSTPEKHPLPKFLEEYRGVHGRPFESVSKAAPCYYLGKMPPEAMRFVNSYIARGNLP